MFILETDRIPAEAAELIAAINASLRKSIHLPSNAIPVSITGELPTIASLAVDVSNGQIDPDQPLPDAIAPADLAPGPKAESFTITGHPISLAGVSVRFDLSAKRVAFAYGHNASGKLIATLTDADDGHLQLKLSQPQLESGILAIAQKLAASSGVAITSAGVTLTTLSPTQIDVRLNITAKKFVSAVIRVSGRLSIDDQMIARATNLNADADGLVGGIAVNLLRPHLQKLNGMPLPLLAFSLGKVKLHGVEVHTSSGLQVTAAFGSEAA